MKGKSPLLNQVGLATAVVDVGLMFAAFAIAYWARYQEQWFRAVDEAYYTTFTPYLPLAILFMALVLVAFMVEGVYRNRREAVLTEEIYAVVNGVTTGFVVMVFLIFFWRPLVYSRLLFVYTAALSIILLAASRVVRRALVNALHGRGVGVSRVLIVGAGELGLEVMRNLVAQPKLGYQVVGFVDDDPEVGNTDIGRFKALGKVVALPQLLDEHQVDEVVITLSWEHHRRIFDLVDQCTTARVQPRIVPDLFQMSLSRVEVRNVAGIPMLSPRESQLTGWGAALKRALDVLGAGLLLLILSPLLAVIALLIRLDSRGPALFTQQRVGRNGRLFSVYKFRSMVQDADQIKQQLRHLNEADGPLFKIRDDPRQTRVGRFLRRTSIDELPQLWNVLRGDMSLVGPRPALPEEVAGYAEWQKKRLSAAPGITGLWQVSGRSDLLFDEMMLLDIYYVENWSPALDASILVRTLPQVILRSGAY